MHVGDVIEKIWRKYTLFLRRATPTTDVEKSAHQKRDAVPKKGPEPDGVQPGQGGVLWAFGLMIGIIVLAVLGVMVLVALIFYIRKLWIDLLYDLR